MVTLVIPLPFLLLSWPKSIFISFESVNILAIHLNLVNMKLNCKHCLYHSESTWYLMLFVTVFDISVYVLKLSFSWFFTPFQFKKKKKKKKSSISSITALEICLLNGQWWCFLFFYNKKTLHCKKSKILALKRMQSLICLPAWLRNKITGSIEILLNCESQVSSKIPFHRKE